jgi:hypothetical protein
MSILWHLLSARWYGQPTFFIEHNVHAALIEMGGETWASLQDNTVVVPLQTAITEH